MPQVHTFQRLMELVLAELRWHACLAYLNDIFVFGRTFEEHLETARGAWMSMES